jgi:predicted phage replisome organizer/uncharacterized phage protein (TIGR02220 family)
MAEVKWIKINTDIFDNKKIKLIDVLPESDAIFRIWIHLLILAANTNNNGIIYLSEKIPYTDEMLSTIFNKPVNIVRLALHTFIQFEMITILENKYIMLNDWSKHQNIEGLEKIREQNRIRQLRFQEKQKTLIEEIDKEKDLDKDIEVINVKNNVIEIIDYLNLKANKTYRHNSKKTIDFIKARLNEGWIYKDFVKVIDNKCSKWLNDKNMNIYLRPETLFGNKFESYLNEININNNTKDQWKIAGVEDD